MSSFLLLIISIIVIGCVYICYSSIRDTNKLQEGLATQGACNIDIGLAYLADGPSEGSGGACTASAAAGAPVTTPCKGIDGRYDFGNPDRYTGGWSLKGGSPSAASCETLCQSQPECKVPGQTCKKTYFPSAKNCYCSFGGYECSISRQCDANADCIAYGQQSNGCWHTLKWDSTETGANKKTKSMYPDYFKVTKPPTAAQCKPPAPTSTGTPLTTDVPVYISNPAAAAAGLGIYLQNTAATGKLEHSSTRNANFILRYPFKSTGPGYFCPTEKNCPLKYTDLVIIQWAQVNNGGRTVDQPDGDTPGCGWYGCRVLQPPNATNSTLTPLFGHGGADPAIFMLMAPPSVTMAKGVGAPTAVQAKLPIYSGDSFCLQYAGTLNNHASVNWGMTSNCGWYGCRVLTDFLKKPPSGADGDFGWEHGGGSDPAPSGGPTGWPNGPTVFKIEMTPTSATPPTTSGSTPPCIAGSPKTGSLPCSCISDPKLQCYDKDGNYNSACCGIGCTGCDGTGCPAAFGPGGNRSCDKPPASCGTGSTAMGAWQEYTEPETSGTKANGWSRMISPDGKIGYVTGKGPCKPGYFWNTPQGKCYYSACPSGTQYQWVDGAKGNPSYQNPDSLPDCLCKPIEKAPNTSGNANATPTTMKCPTEYPHLLNYTPQNKFFCYANPDGNTTGEGGLCNCDCANCGFNDSFKNCSTLGATCNKAPKAGEHWASCSNSDECLQPDNYCRQGDKRCLTDADCKWANSVDKTNRDCTRMPKTTPSINTPCDSDKILKKGDPDPNGTGNITTEMNPEGVKIFNQDVTKIFNPTTGDGKVYFYPEQPTGQDLFADAITSRTRDSNGTLYLYTHMNSNGLRIRESAADCFSDSTYLYVGGPPTKPLPSWCPTIANGPTGWDNKTTQSGCKWTGVSPTDPTSCVYQQQQWCTTDCKGTWVGPNDKKSPWCINMPGSSGSAATGHAGVGKCSGLTGDALEACNCVQGLSQCNWSNWSQGVYNKCNLGQSGWAAAAGITGSEAVDKFCSTYNDAAAAAAAGLEKTQQKPSGPCDPGKGQMSCCINCGGVKLNALAATGLTASQFADICKTRNSPTDCAVAGGTWKVDPNTITSAKACAAAGGTDYAYCATNDVHYCKGPCAGDQSCGNDASLKSNACTAAQTYSGGSSIKVWKKVNLKGADYDLANGTYTKSGENQYGTIWLKTGCQIERNADTWYLSCPAGSAPIYAATATTPDYPPNTGWYKQRSGAPPVNISPQDNGTITNITGDDLPSKCAIDYACSINSHRKSPLPSSCPESGCQEQDCCAPNPYCSSMTSCPTGRQLKADPASIRCAGAECQDKECCEPIPHEKCTAFPCPTNYSRKSNAADIVCAATMCIDEECCVPDPKPTCGSDPVLCPYGYENKTSPNNVSCASYKCTDADCCLMAPPQPNITDITKTSQVDNRQWIDNSQRTENIDLDDHQRHSVVQNDPRVFTSATEISNPGKNSVFYPGATFIVINGNEKKRSDPSTYMHYDAWGTPKMPNDTRTNNMFSGYGSPSSHFVGPVNNDDPFATSSPSSDSTQFGPTAFNANLYMKG